MKFIRSGLLALFPFYYSLVYSAVSEEGLWKSCAALGPAYEEAVRKEAKRQGHVSQQGSRVDEHGRRELFASPMK